MRQPIERGALSDGFGGRSHQLVPEFLLHGADKFLEAPGIEHVFEPRLGTIAAVTVVDEHAYDRIRHLGRLGGLDDDAGIAGEVLMAGNAAKHEPEPDAGLDTEAVFDLDGLKSDVVGVFQHRDDAAAIEADVELARNAVKRTIVEDVEMPFARVGACVEQFLRIDSRGRRSGHVADVVGTRAARAQAEILDRLDHGHGVLRLDLAHLQVGACGHVGVAAGIALGEIGEPGELPVGENAVRYPQAAHVGLLRRRTVEQPEEPPAKIIVGLRCFVLGRLFF